MMTAITALLMLAGLGAAVDYGTLSLKSTQLQQLADTAAVSGAKEMALAGSSNEPIKTRVAAYIAQDGKLNVGAHVEINWKSDTLKVNLEERWAPFFAQFLDASITPIFAQAFASLLGSSPTGDAAVLDFSGTSTISLSGSTERN